MHPNIDLIEPKDYDFTVTKLRDFFRSQGFVETPVQHRLSILAACEDPLTIATFNYAGNLWPLPQTGQMWLEWELLTKPNVPGYYCITTSFRNEANPIPGRHNLIFPMCEFETHGDINDLKKLEEALLVSIGLGDNNSFKHLDYEAIAAKYGVKELKAQHETKMMEEFGPTVFLEKFPQHTSPFWNMKKDGNYARKIDVILYGIETIGSAERSTNPEEMRHMFNTISDGLYAKTLFSQFGQERVNEELNRFLKLKFFPRCGGGIGLTRMIRAFKLAGSLK
ncbi:MAG: tRNA ligase [Parcubacteria group bacterium GW2011_GWD2_43_10]|nr:MAG: tRNA ligase [Parcubacteria group bacterium GW2011_GWD2_43_10]KKT22012.1 MAG: tRNA ligase [Parcubacteria group bacterium GW2011_GWE1_43_8]